MGLVLVAVVTLTLGFAAGSLCRRSTDALLRAALRALDAAERDVTHWRELARYWERRHATWQPTDEESRPSTGG